MHNQDSIISCSTELHEFWKSSSVDRRCKIVSMSKNQLFMALKKRYVRRCTCEDCIRRKIPYFDDHAKLFDKIAKMLETEGCGKGGSEEESSCLRSDFVFASDALYIKGDDIYLKKELAENETFPINLEAKIRETRKSEKTEKYCETCHAVREFQCLVGTSMLHLLQATYEYTQAKERAEQAASELLKVLIRNRITEGISIKERYQKELANNQEEKMQNMQT